MASHYYPRVELVNRPEIEVDVTEKAWRIRKSDQNGELTPSERRGNGMGSGRQIPGEVNVRAVRFTRERGSLQSDGKPRNAGQAP